MADQDIVRWVTIQGRRIPIRAPKGRAPQARPGWAIVEIPEIGDPRFKRWAKWVRSVNQEHTTGFAFEGDWLRMGEIEELPEGAYVMVYGERGSRRFHKPVVQLLQVRGGKLQEVRQWEDLSPRRWALAIRDEVAEIVHGSQQTGPPPQLKEAVKLLAGAIDDLPLSDSQKGALRGIIEAIHSAWGSEESAAGEEAQ